jgi:hypothetical protein
MTERERFMSRLAKDRDAGLVDLKFFFQPRQPMEPEEIFAALNEVEEAIESGKCFTHSGWSGNDVRV